MAKNHCNENFFTFERQYPKGTFRRKTASVTANNFNIILLKDRIFNKSRPISRVLYRTEARLPSFILATYPFWSHLSVYKRRVASSLFRVQNIFGLATRETNSRPCCHERWWALAPPSHPYRGCPWRLFSSPYLCPREHLLFQELGTLCCPDFPLPKTDSDGMACFAANVVVVQQ